MSWDVVLLRIHGDLRPVEEVDDADYLPLGSADAVRAAVAEAFPGIEWSDEQSGFIDSGKFAIELAMEEADPVGHVMLSVHGGGDPVTPIMELVTRNGWAALDASTSTFIDPAKPSDASWSEFQRFRDEVARQYNGDAAGES